MSGSAASEFVHVAWRGRCDRIEHRWIERERADKPLMVFLHEGLGSLAMWKDFPIRLCAHLGWRGLVFSRWGYGSSSPRLPHEQWPIDFMHEQARDFMPALFAALGLGAGAPVWLFGHSDGGSIALIHAALFPDAVAGLIVAAPHLFVEPASLRSIRETRQAYLTTDLRARLAAYHDDPDSAFWGWNDVWLRPGFDSGDIVPLLGLLRCPVLALQGNDDHYGTMAQIESIAHNVPQARLLKLPDCGHSPHRDRPEALIEAVAAFVAGPARVPAREAQAGSTRNRR